MAKLTSPVLDILLTTDCVDFVRVVDIKEVAGGSSLYIQIRGNYYLFAFRLIAERASIGKEALSVLVYAPITVW